jgi:hypothetical protein
MTRSKNPSSYLQSSDAARSSEAEFDFDAEKKKLRQMMDDELREHGQECGRRVDAELKTSSIVWHAHHRYELAKEEFRRRQDEKRGRRSE